MGPFRGLQGVPRVLSQPAWGTTPLYQLLGPQYSAIQVYTLYRGSSSGGYLYLCTTVLWREQRLPYTAVRTHVHAYIPLTRTSIWHAVFTTGRSIGDSIPGSYVHTGVPRAPPQVNKHGRATLTGEHTHLECITIPTIRDTGAPPTFPVLVPLTYPLLPSRVRTVRSTTTSRGAHTVGTYVPGQHTLWPTRDQQGTRALCCWTRSIIWLVA